MSLSVITARRASDEQSPRFLLAEGPVWNAESGTVLWVDVLRGTVLEAELAGDSLHELRRWQFEGTVGAVAPGPHQSLLVVAQEHLMVVNASGSLTDGVHVIESGDPSRTNDAACDPAGRLIVGTMAFDELGGHDRLMRLEADGSLLVLDDDLGISNGIAWSPDGTTMYSADTLHQVIWARDYDAESGSTGARRVGLRVDGYPDGICVDSAGDLWVAMWGRGEAHHYALGGDLVDVVKVAAPHVSSVCFVGDDLDRLLITTSSHQLDAEGLAANPDAGRLFLADVGVTGLPTTPWSGAGIDSRGTEPIATREGEPCV